MVDEFTKKYRENKFWTAKLKNHQSNPKNMPNKLKKNKNKVFFSKTYLKKFRPNGILRGLDLFKTPKQHF